MFLYEPKERDTDVSVGERAPSPAHFFYIYCSRPAPRRNWAFLLDTDGGKVDNFPCFKAPGSSIPHPLPFISCAPHTFT